MTQGKRVPYDTAACPRCGGEQFRVLKSGEDRWINCVSCGAVGQLTPQGEIQLLALRIKQV